MLSFGINALLPFVCSRVGVSRVETVFLTLSTHGLFILFGFV